MKIFAKFHLEKNVDNREEVDTLPYHFTLSTWDISNEENVIKELSKI